jgi:hypothetical protein
MAYTITPVNKTGVGTATVSSTTVTTTNNGFRNVAVGATIIIGGNSRTVTAKASDTSLTINSTTSTSTWTYTNPALTLTTIQTLSVKKASSPMKITLPTMDSDQLIAFDIDGVERTLQISAEVADTTTNLANVVIPTIESLCDGQQFTAGKFSLTTDMPSRTYYLYASDVNWEYSAEFVNKLQVSLSLLERGV